MRSLKSYMIDESVGGLIITYIIVSFALYCLVGISAGILIGSEVKYVVKNKELRINKLFRWIRNLLENTKVAKIVNKLKGDAEVISFFKNNETYKKKEWMELLKRKLKPEEVDTITNCIKDNKDNEVISNIKECLEEENNNIIL